MFQVLGMIGTRGEILRLALTAEEITAQQIMDELGIGRTAVTKQVTPLVDAGLLIERRAYTSRGSGRLLYWRADRDRIRDTFAALIGRVFSDPQFRLEL